MRDFDELLKGFDTASMKPKEYRDVHTLEESVGRERGSLGNDEEEKSDSREGAYILSEPNTSPPPTGADAELESPRSPQHKQ